MSYDPKCYELADHFLPSVPDLPAGARTRQEEEALQQSAERLRGDLAQHIQDSIEEWLIEERDRVAQQLRGPTKQ